MFNILKLSAVAGVATEVKRRTSFALQLAVRIAVACTLLAAGAAFVTAAGWLKLSEIYGVINANLIVGVALIAAGMLTYILGVVVPHHYKQRYSASSQTTFGIGAAPRTGLPQGIDLSTLATLAAVGVAAGRFFRR